MVGDMSKYTSEAQPDDQAEVGAHQSPKNQGTLFS